MYSGPCAGRDPLFSRNGVRLFVGEQASWHALYRFTFELARRILEHKTRAVPGFTAKYGVDRLVWYESVETLEQALIRGRQIKKWKREWKVNLIERDNPHWIDLFSSLTA